MKGKEKRVLGVEAIIVDMDGTAVRYPNEPFHSTWDALADVFCEDDRKIWLDFKNKYLGKPELYSKWYEEQVEMLGNRRIHIEQARGILFPVPYSKGFVEFFKSSNGFKRGILSKGLHIVAEKIAEELGFEYVCADILEIDEQGYFTGRGKSNNFGLEKSGELIEMLFRMGVSPREACYVGDAPGDISCFETVGMPVIFEPKSFPDQNESLLEYSRRKNVPVIEDFREIDNLINLNNRR